VVTKKDKTLAAAQKFLERGQLDKALAEFAKVVQEDPKDTRTWLKMAELHAKRGAADQATEIYLKTGELYTEQGFFQKAVAVYKNVLKLSPSYVQGHAKLAEVFKRLGLISDAVQQYELAAFAYQKTGRPAEALGSLRAIVELTPDNVVSRIKLAESASQSGATEEAIQEFARAADQLKLQGRHEEYTRVAERLLFHQPDNLGVARELAEAYIDKNNARLALAKLQVCLKAEPRAPENVSLLARAFEQLDVPKAVSVLKELIEIHQQLGHTAERDVTIRRALGLDPKDPDLLDAARRYGINVGVGLTPPPIPGGSSMRPPIPVGSGVGRLTPPRPPPSPSPAASGFDLAPSSGVRTPPPSVNDLARIIAESDVFVKYGLLDRAADHLRRAFDIQADYLPAREKLAAVLAQLGRRNEAAAELEYMAERLADVDRSQAFKLAERARALDPTATRALEALEGGQSRLKPGGRSPGFGPHTAITAAAVPAVPPRRPPPQRSGAVASVEAGGGLELDFGDDIAPPATGDQSAEGFDSSDEVEELDLDVDGEESSDGDTTGLDLVAPGDRAALGADSGSLSLEDGASQVSEEVAAELEQADFFLNQSMPDEALAILQDLQSRHPGNEAIARKMVEVERAIAPPPPPIDDSAFGISLRGDDDDASNGPLRSLDPEPQSVDLEPRRSPGPSQPLRSLDPEAHAPSPVAVVAGGEKADLSTHGDLGIAYKEMGLLDAAIGEFKLLTQDPAREVFALTMIGECCEAKGSLTDAIIRYKEALNCPQITVEEMIQLYYCLGSTFERLSDRSEALYFYEKVAKKDPKFRDVVDKLASLRPRSVHP
jgi:tetratricopeptide (TPR) repeat protein